MNRWTARLVHDDGWYSYSIFTVLHGTFSVRNIVSLYQQYQQ